MNENKPWFHGANVAIKMKEGDIKALDNLVMATPSEKDVLTQITSTIKKLSENNKNWNGSNQNPDCNKYALDSKRWKSEKTSQKTNYRK